MRTIQQLVKAEALSAWVVLHSHMLPQLGGHMSVLVLQHRGSAHVCGSQLRPAETSARPALPWALAQWSLHVLSSGLQRLCT